MPVGSCTRQIGGTICDDIDYDQVCRDGTWGCPPGMVLSSTCTCHGFCILDAGSDLGDASDGSTDAAFGADCGGALTVACDPSTGACMSYTTTCVDDGYVPCDAATYATHAGLEAFCRAYCTVDGGPRDAACASVLSP